MQFLGRIHAGILTNSEVWEKACVDSGKVSADLCFPMLFAPELLFKEFKSEIADMKVVC